MHLITGATGLLGSAVAARLTAEGTPFVAARRDMVDLQDPDATIAFWERHRPDVVVHCAARVHGLMGNRRYPADIYDENLLINTNVIRASRLAGARKVVAASTVAAYPGHLVTGIVEDDFLAGPPHVGEQAYAHAKRAMLAQLEAYEAQHGLSFVYGILTNLYGPRDRFDIENGHVIPSLVTKFHAAALRGGAVEVWGRGRAERDFLYVDDAAEALLHLAATQTGAFNIASGTSVPIARVVEILSQVSGVDRVEWQPDRPEGQLERSYDVNRLHAIGFEPRHSLEDGLRLTYEWYAANHADVRR